MMIGHMINFKNNDSEMIDTEVYLLLLIIIFRTIMIRITKA